MIASLRSFLNKINQVLFIAFLLDFLIKDQKISMYINTAFLVSIFIESFFLTSDQKKAKTGEIIFPKSLIDLMSRKIKTVLYLLSLGALLYYIIISKWNMESVVNVALPLYFATFLKQMIGIRLGTDYLQISGINQKAISIEDIKTIQWINNQILVKTDIKTYSAKGLHPQSIIDIQEYLFKHKINHINIVV